MSTLDALSERSQNLTLGPLRSFETDSEGKYSTIALKPTPYPIPFDGPAGNLLQMMDRHPYRPAHIHVSRTLLLKRAES